MSAWCIEFGDLLTPLVTYRYPGQESNMGDPASAAWSVSASGSDGRMMWTDETKSGMYQEDNRTSTHNGMQSDPYERVSLNSRLKTMILNKQMNHHMQQYNQQMSMDRVAAADGCTTHPVMSPGNQQRSTVMSQAQYVSSSSSTAVSQPPDTRSAMDVDHMMVSDSHHGSIMGGRPTASIERKQQLDNQSSAEVNFLAQGHHPQNHLSVMTSEGGGFPWDWSATTAHSDIMDGNSISAMESFIKYAASEDRSGIIDKSLDLATSSASVKHFVPNNNTSPAGFQQKSTSRQSGTTVNWHSPVLPQEHASVTSNNNSNSSSSSSSNSSSSSSNNNNNNNNNYKDQVFKCSTPAANTYKCRRDSSADVDDKSFQQRIGIAPESRSEYQNNTYAPSKLAGGMEDCRMQGIAGAPAGVCQYQQDYEPSTTQMKNEGRKVIPTSMADGNYLSEQGFGGGNTSLKSENQKSVANNMVAVSGFHCQMFDNMDASNEVSTSLVNNTYSCQSFEQTNSSSGQNDRRTATPSDKVMQPAKVKMERPSYLFAGDGGPIPLEKVKGSWCCRQGGTETPTPEHLRDGCCQGFQTADEQVQTFKNY